MAGARSGVQIRRRNFPGTDENRGLVIHESSFIFSFHIEGSNDAKLWGLKVNIQPLYVLPSPPVALGKLHRGEWREFGMTGHVCAIDVESMEGSTCLCCHEVGAQGVPPSQVLLVDHWSCCGNPNRDALGCQDPEICFPENTSAANISANPPQGAKAAARGARPAALSL
jgi:hypothetical protein